MPTLNYRGGDHREVGAEHVESSPYIVAAFIFAVPIALFSLLFLWIVWFGD